MKPFGSPFVDTYVMQVDERGTPVRMGRVTTCTDAFADLAWLASDGTPTPETARVPTAHLRDDRQMRVYGSKTQLLADWRLNGGAVQ